MISALQMYTIESTVTRLLVATKQLLESLTQWARGEASEQDVSDIYVSLGNEFNVACRAFLSSGIDVTYVITHSYFIIKFPVPNFLLAIWVMCPKLYALS